MAPTLPSLANEDVRDVFDFVLVGGADDPPEHLSDIFHVVHFPWDAATPSMPPQVAFEDGLYILCDTKHPKFPSRLADYVVEASDPQFWKRARTKQPQRFQGTQYQMRSCIPERGNSFQRGDLWTIYAANGEENTEYRLFHVYPYTRPSQVTSGSTKKTKRAQANKRNAATESPDTPGKESVLLTMTTPSAKKLKKQAAAASPPARLSDQDVMDIFDSVLHKRTPPPHLIFSVVPAGTNDADLRPPCFAFDDGMYVLLRPPKKAQQKKTSVPSHLLDYLLEDVPKRSCAWKLGGPRRPPKALTCQIRSCTPDSGRHKGDIWTIYDADGKEDLQYRLFHVYPHSPQPRQFAGKEMSCEVSVAKASLGSEGCVKCGKDDDYNELMICESCEMECHTYCAGLSTVPTGDWFCATCAKDENRPADQAALAKKKRSRAGTMVSSDESDISPHDNCLSINFNRVEHAAPEHVYCKLTKRFTDGKDEKEVRVGFVQLESRNATFADARKAIQSQMDKDSLPDNSWKFYLPPVGPVSHKQEETLGSVLAFLQGEMDGRLGNGSLEHPLELILLV